MDYLPNDPHILASAVNYLLRDGIYADLDKICYDYGVSRKALEAKLLKAGYEYNAKEKKFWPLEDTAPERGNSRH